MRRYEASQPRPHRTAEAASAQTRPLRALLPYFVFAAACYLVAPYLGLSSRDVDPRIAEVWPPGGVGFVLLTTIWFTGRRVRARHDGLHAGHVRDHRDADGLRPRVSRCGWACSPSPSPR